MTISRHTQVEDLANLLGVRRSQMRERTHREAAYLNLVSAVLGVPVAEVQPGALITGARPVLVMGQRVADQAEYRIAAHTRCSYSPRMFAA